MPPFMPPFFAEPPPEVTPRMRRGVDWASAAARVDQLAEALREAELSGFGGGAASPPRATAAPPRFHHSEYSGEEAPGPGMLRSAWTTSGARTLRGPAAGAAGPAAEPPPPAAGGAYSTEGEPASTWREAELARRLAEAERTISRLQLAAALSEMRDATSNLGSGGGEAAAAAAGGAGSPALERARLRAERAEREAEVARAERDAALARVSGLEAELENAGDTCALLRRRAEEAEARGGGVGQSAPPPPLPQQPPSPSRLLPPALVEELVDAVRSAEWLPREARRVRLRALRLRWHPDKHDVLRGLATTVTQVLNAEVTEMQKRLALGDEELW